MTTDTNALRALVAKATPGPWKVILSPHGPRYNCVQHGEDQNYTSLEMEPGDAALIVAAVNALPALLDELAAARRDAERARQELLNIANADPREWGETSDQFQQWAQNRARHTLAAIDAARGKP